MLSQGIHLKVVSERLGHSTIGITGDFYSHVQPTVQREAVERFGDAWRSMEHRGGLWSIVEVYGASWRSGNGKRMANEG
jgi:hypothetical protein